MPFTHIFAAQIHNNQKFMKKLMLSAVAVTVFFAACNKSDDNASRQEMLVGKWNLTEFGADANQNGSIDAGETTATSTIGMTLVTTLNSDGTSSSVGTFAGMPTDTTAGKWNLMDGEQTLRVIEDGDTTDFIIKGLESSKMTLLDKDGGPLAQWGVFQKL
jgi:hypothetical protein